MRKQNKKLDGKEFNFSDEDKQLLKEIKEGKHITIQKQTDVSSKQVADTITKNVQKELNKQLKEQIKTDELNSRLSKLEEMRKKEIKVIENKAKYYKKVAYVLLALCVILALVSSFAGGLFNLIGLDNFQSFMLAEMKQAHGFLKFIYVIGFIALPVIWIGALFWLCKYLLDKISY